MWSHNPNTHSAVCRIISCRTLNNFSKLQSSWSFVLKNKQTDHTSNIMSKRHGVFTKNLIIFFSNAGETEDVPEFKFERF